MGTLKSSGANLTINADGSGNDIKFQSNGSEVASISDAGVMTATSFAGNGANLTSLPTDSTKLSLSGGTMTGNTVHGDNVKDTYGDSADLEIYHDGSNSYVKEVGTGNLKILADNLQIKNSADNELKAYFDTNGGAALYHDNGLKIETTSSGATVTGTLGVTTVDLGNWTITESGGVLFFATGGTNKMKLDASGNLTCVGDVTANGIM